MDRLWIAMRWLIRIGAGLETQASRGWRSGVARFIVMALLCWVAVSVPAIVIVGTLMRGSKTKRVPTPDSVPSEESAGVDEPAIPV